MTADDVYSVAGLRGGFSQRQWKLLPLKLRQRWWRETDYGANVPSDELKADIRAALTPGDSNADL